MLKSSVDIQFKEEMRSLGFAHRAAGIFSRKISADFYHWLSIDLTNPKGDILVGSIFISLNKKIYEIAKNISASAKPAFALSWGPPAFSHKLGNVDDDELMRPYNLARAAERFLADKAELGCVIETLSRGELFSWNRTQVVASGLVLLGRCCELRELERESQLQGAVADFVQAANAMCSPKLHNSGALG
jgi:hypothetical protein